MIEGTIKSVRQATLRGRVTFSKLDIAYFNINTLYRFARSHVRFPFVLLVDVLAHGNAAVANQPYIDKFLADFNVAGTFHCM